MSIVAILLIALVATGCKASTTTLADSASTTDTTAEREPAASESTEPASGDEPVAEAPAETNDEPADEPEAETQADTTSEASTDDEPETPETADPSGPLGAGEASVELLDAGSEPRRELRFNIAVTCGELTELTQTQELSQVADGFALPATGPISTVTEMETSATPNGDNYDVTAVVLSAGAAPGTDPTIAASLDVQLSGMVGLTSISTITKRGILIPGSVRVEGAGGLGGMEGLLEGLSQAQNPLPFEAVGLGARWVTRSAIEVEGLLVETITTFELVDLDETLVTLSVSGSQVVDAGGVMNMQGISAEVTQWDVTSNGSVTMDLATISPITMSMRSSGVQGFRAAGSEVVQEITTDIETRTEPNTGCTGRTTRP